MIQKMNVRMVMPAWLARCAAVLLLALGAGAAQAQSNAIESITATQQGRTICEISLTLTSRTEEPG